MKRGVGRSLVVFLAGMLGCGGAASNGGTQVEDTAVVAAPQHVEIINLECDESFAVARLEALLVTGDAAVASLAARALGRIGDDAAISALLTALQSAAPAAELAITEALGFSSSPQSESALIERAGATTVALRVRAVTALGAVGTPAAIVALTKALADDSTEVVAAAALSLGRMGRRSIALPLQTRTALKKTLRDARASEPAVRYALVYALAQEHDLDSGDDAVLAALVEAASDDDPTVRAAAVAGLARRPKVRSEAALTALLTALLDPEWRVRVEAIRGLAAPARGPDAHAAIAVSMARAWAESIGGNDHGAAHVAHLAAEVLGEVANEKSVANAVQQFATALGGQDPGRTLAASTLHCKLELLKALATNQRAGLANCGGGARAAIDPVRRRALMQDAIARGPANAKSVLSVAGHGLKDTATLVRVAAVRAVGHRLADKAMATEMVPLLLSALDDVDAAVRGEALDILAAGDLPEGSRPAAAEKVIALLADGDLDVEVRMSGLAALGALGQSSAMPTCRLDHSHGNRSVRSAARACLVALAAPDPGTGAARRPGVPPQVSPATLAGKSVEWIITTSRGDITIALWPDVAPWAVAALVGLSRQKFFDETVFHRVVPGFVVQGGDPTGTGWGGPGFVLPPEPSAIAFEAGTVGIADAGPGTGGSQFFIMHGRAPHLDGRYTVVGKVTGGLDVAVSLLVGDRILGTSVRLDGKDAANGR